MMQVSTLRPGYLVSLKTTVSGNVSYSKVDLEMDHFDSDGAKRAKWETERTVSRPEEHDEAIKVRGKARSLITACCSGSSFGLLCPEFRKDDLAKAISDARVIADEFNARAEITRVSVNVVAGRVEQNDVEAVRAINGEVRELLAEMEAGLKRLDVEAVRAAANKARSLGQMLTPDAEKRIAGAIAAARTMARKIVKSGEVAAEELDRDALQNIRHARTAFLDLDEAGEIQAPSFTGRALDLTEEPSESEAERAEREAAEIAADAVAQQSCPLDLDGSVADFRQLAAAPVVPALPVLDL